MVKVHVVEMIVEMEIEIVEMIVEMEIEKNTTSK